MTDLRTMAVRLPVAAIAKLDAMRMTARRTRSDMVRELICREIGVEPDGPQPEPPPKLIARIPTVAPRRPREPLEPAEPRSAYELFSAGVPITGIAAMLRRPYREICIEIGLEVDALPRGDVA